MARQRTVRQWMQAGVMVLVCAMPVLAQPLTQLSSLKITSDHGHQEYRLRFNHMPHFKAFGLSKPDRYVVDLIGVKSRLKQVPWFKPGDVRKLRMQAHGHNTRLVFDLKRSVRPQIVRRRIPRVGYDLVIRFPMRAAVVKKPVAHKAVATKPKPRPATTEVTKPNLSARNIIIVIDPGHGGKDPGAHGPHGVREKQVVLGISKRLAAAINATPGFRAQLTRHTDRFLKLRERLHKARKYRADAFVAIHADAYRNRRAQGASVYALSARGATSEAARWLAEKENVSEMMGGAKLDGSRMLRSVLIDLQQTATIAASLDMGSRVLRRLSEKAKLHRHYVEQAAFVVLKSPDIPSLLVESGFISNPSEERRLRSPTYQKSLAFAIKDGIISYFEHHPPRDTALWTEKHLALK